MEKTNGFRFPFSCGQPGWRILISGDWRSLCIMRAIFIIRVHRFSSLLFSFLPIILFYFFFFLTEETRSSALSRFRCHVLCIDYAAVVKQLC
jgi:hypothetical protein